MIHPAYETYRAELSAATDPDATLEERRRIYRERVIANQGPLEEMAEVRDGVVELSGRSLRTRLYVPPRERGGAVVVFFHGGSFVFGDLDTHEALCRRLSVDTEWRFLAVEYRLAPESPFPAAVDDAVDVLRYVCEHVEEFAPEGTRVVAMGESAGGSLVASACAAVGDELPVAAQVLIYPTLGPEVVTESSHRYGTGYVLELDQLRQDYKVYLGDFADHTDPRVSPLFATDLIGVAPAIIVVAECDPLRDEAIAYAGLLEHFGVRVEVLEAEGMLHGFLRMGHVIPDALDVVDDVAEHLASYLRD